MKVRELIELLQQEDPEREVILSRDAEGNGYSPCDGEFGTGAYRPTTAWSGEYGIEALTDVLEAGGYTDEDVVEGIPALVLYPMN